jgi:hypothetical protein
VNVIRTIAAVIGAVYVALAVLILIALPFAEKFGKDYDRRGDDQ